MKQLITNEQCKLQIGPYTIYITNMLDKDNYYLHEYTEPYQEASNESYSSTSTDMHYTIQYDAEFVEPMDITVAGFKKGPVPYKIYRTASGDYLWVRGNKEGKVKLAFEVTSNWNAWRLLADYSGTNGVDSFNELVYIFSYSILNKQGIMFHGVIMEWQRKGIIVCAHSGVGKTTHTRMWRDKEGARIINGDRALCCKSGEEWYAHGAPWCGSSGEFMNKRVDLSAIVIIERAKENRVVRLSPIKGAMELMQLAFAPAWDETMMNHCLSSIDGIVRSIPIFKLSCTPDLRAVAALKSEISQLD